MLKVTKNVNTTELSKMLDRMSAACGGRIKFEVEGPADGEAKEVSITCGPEEVKLLSNYGMQCRGTVAETQKAWRLKFTGKALERMIRLHMITEHEFAADLNKEKEVEEFGRKMCADLGFEEGLFSIQEVEYVQTLEGPAEKKAGNKRDYSDLQF